MIDVIVHEDKIEVSGHAGYAPRGQDIVCAGVTALTQTLAASLDGLTEDNPDYTIAPGVFKIETKDLSDKARFLIDSFFIGICGIAEAYPEYVRIA
jgi:uncharacterized protein YsxB (DUF464 family)